MKKGPPRVPWPGGDHRFDLVDMIARNLKVSRTMAHAQWENRISELGS